MKKNRKTARAKRHRPVPVSMPPELEKRIADAATAVRLSKQDVMRLSIDRGIDVLRAQLLSVN